MKRLLAATLLILILVGVVGSVIFIDQSSPVSADISSKNFVINKGEGLISISSKLQSGGFVKNKYVFIAYAFRFGLNNKLQAGLFRLYPSLSTPQIVIKLTKGGNQDYWLKIIEGTRVEEIIKEYPILSSGKEGYLFPDSYLIPQDYTSSQIIDLIDKNLEKKISDARQLQTADISISQAVTLASILEREARSLTSKQMVSGILLNRLKINMPMQIDATVQYARDTMYSKTDNYQYWRPLSKSDLSIASTYNTYLHPGLPPGPICNPGLDSLYAAFHPTASDYLFYITGNDNQMHYAKTLDEHNANIAKYLK